MPPDYLITTKLPAPTEGPDVIRERLVRAKNESAAMKHVVSDTIKIERATIDDAVRLSRDGVEIEKVAE